MNKTIAISLIPNCFVDDIILAVKTLINPFSWKKGKAVSEIENYFKKFFSVEHAFSFNSGRSALTIGLKALSLPEGSEVLMQAFSCVVVANSIRFAGLKPVFVDIAQNSFCMDYKDLTQKITSKSKVIIVQNLFGIPDKIESILEIAKKYKLILVEDCAQSLGAEYKSRLVGQYGKFAFFSFGRDKVISSTFGGMLVTEDPTLAEKIKEIYEKIPYPGYFWIIRQLMHPLIFSLVLPTYFLFRIGKFSFGKGIIFALAKTRLLDFPVKTDEKKGLPIDDYPKKMPNALAILALNQFLKLSKFNKRRKEIAQYYLKKLSNIKNVLLPNFDFDSQPIFLRLPFFTKNRDQLVSFAKLNQILLGNWYDAVLAPRGSNLHICGYKMGSCPRAERAANEVVNLPTYPRMSIDDADKVIDTLRQYYGHQSQGSN